MRVRTLKTGPVDLIFDAPASKSYTHRALIIASLATGDSVLTRPLFAEDTLLTLKSLRRLGVRISVKNEKFFIEGTGGIFPRKRPVKINLDNNGTGLRLLTAFSLLTKRPVTLTGNERMQERPIGPLVSGLNKIGGNISAQNGTPPVHVSGKLSGGFTTLSGSVSSQFISSILIASPCAETDVELELPELPVSASYIDITLDMMRSFGANVKNDSYTHFSVDSRSKYSCREYQIEGDFSSSSYLFAIAAVNGGSVTVKGLSKDSFQGDKKFLDILEKMGCKVEYHENKVRVTRDGPMTGVSVDMSKSPDTVQTVCAIAPFADTETTISGIHHLKYKESDRIKVMAKILQSMEIETRVTADTITIKPGKPGPADIDPEGDHRTAMSSAVMGFISGEVVIRSAECVKKSFPDFWVLLEERGLCQRLS